MNRKKRRKKHFYATSQVFLQMLIIVLVILVLVAAFLIHKTSTEGPGIDFIGTDNTNSDNPPNNSESRPAVDPPPLSTAVTTAPPLGPIAENQLYDGFELPINGATGYASLATEVREGPADNFEVILNLEPGDVFTILSLSGDWLQIKSGTIVGWMPSIQCMVNPVPIGKILQFSFYFPSRFKVGIFTGNSV